ncbi:zinc ABC transporter permease AztB [Agromyces atrinae]|uniref:ABC-type Mn2+/Zn2+ transport system permease subunit n=1 Tax=Agromyces atrinae TaxID=592376 RepID=A0A4Q2M659_9MICO|nr:zinc ABC transporter permease AztB [Agromyces atrinae]NYD68196.1 ABC-type Mn2+/Zn2+ transport system permease subunit [Agromyces atrinae]RXZ87664.1 metal ABC transporter permease [Agromyces atrinae]
MTWLLEPFATEFMVRALLGGALVSLVCAVVGTWVVVRGLAFLGEAMAHGMLPGVATAALLGAPAALGAGVAAVAMAVGVTAVSRRAKLAQDTSIGLLFVGMLALGVIIVSASRGFAVDLTAVLFGDILAITWADVGWLAVAAVVAVVFCALMHRAFVALAFDQRKAATLGLRPAFAHYALLGAVALAVVASYQAVGTLLVVGFLIAPPATAALWVRRLPSIMALAVGFGVLATVVGLLVSWHLGSAAGATIAASAIAFFAVSALVRRAV